MAAAAPPTTTIITPTTGATIAATTTTTSTTTRVTTTTATATAAAAASGKYVNVMLRLRHLDLGRHWRDLMKTRDSQHDGMMIMLAGDGDGGGGLGGHELCCCCCSIFQLSPLCPHVRFPVYSMPLCMTDVCVCVFRFLGCLAAITLALGVPFGKHAVVHGPQPGYSITRSVLGCKLASAHALRNGMCRKYLMPFSILCFRVYALIMGYWIL